MSSETIDVYIDRFKQGRRQVRRPFVTFIEGKSVVKTIDALKEEDIIQGCKEGIARCQKALVHRYSPMLISVARRYVRDADMAQDVLQDAYIRIFRYIGKYQPTGSFEAWMRRIVITTALKTIEKKSYRNEINCIEDISQPGVPPEIYSQMGKKELMEVIDSLPGGFRQVFCLYVIEGYSHAEIGEMLGISESTSRSQLTRARQQLRKLILQIQKASA